MWEVKLSYRKTDEIHEEDLDLDLLRQKVIENPGFKIIFSELWRLVEELGTRGNLQDLANLMRNCQQTQIDEMHKEWERASGLPMTLEQEPLAFGNPKSKVSFAIIDKMIDFIEHMAKASEIAKLFGLDSLAPIAVSKKTRGWSKGGKAKAEQQKEEIEKTRERRRELHQKMKENNPGMSNHAVDLKIAKKENVKRGSLYNARKKNISKRK